MENKAPGKHYRKGIPLPELFRMFPDNDAAQAWFEKQRWGDEPWCPHCGSFNVRPDKSTPQSWRCKNNGCRKRFSAKVGTPLYKSKLDYQTLIVAIYLMTTSLKSVSSMKLHRDLDITQKTAWHLAHRIREAFECDSDGGFRGPVEVDETYFGGKRSFQHDEIMRQGKDYAAGKRVDLSKPEEAVPASRFSRRVTDFRINATPEQLARALLKGGAAPRPETRKPKK